MTEQEQKAEAESGEQAAPGSAEPEQDPAYKDLEPPPEQTPGTTLPRSTNVGGRPTRQPPRMPHGPIAQRIVAEFPGRGPGPSGPKPTEEETEFRSEMAVTGRMSADGNGYRKGEPIPENEYRRQQVALGRIGGGLGTAGKVRIPQHICDNCRGSGLRMPSHEGKNHKAGCPGCKPCTSCEGRGRIAARTEQHPPADVTQLAEEVAAGG